MAVRHGVASDFPAPAPAAQAHQAAGRVSGRRWRSTMVPGVVAFVLPFLCAKRRLVEVEQASAPEG